MPAPRQFGPLERLSWLDRRRWSRRARKVEREFEADTLAGLQSLAGSGAALEWMSSTVSRSGGRSARRDGLTPGPVLLGAGVAGPVEFSAGGRRVVAAAVWAPAWDALVGAWRGTVVTLAGVGRYHRSWVLRFRITGGSGPHPGVVREFVLLASRVRLIDHWGGSRAGGDFPGMPASPFAVA